MQDDSMTDYKDFGFVENFALLSLCHRARVRLLL